VKAREDPPRAAQHGGVSHAPEIHGRTAIVVGDGLATGAPMQAAITSLRRLAPAALVAAGPVGSRDAYEDLGGEVDALICRVTREPCEAGAHGDEDCSEAGDAELRAARSRTGEPAGATESTDTTVGV
jgi:putative phosphoribosyl transferase